MKDVRALVLGLIVAGCASPTEPGAVDASIDAPPVPDAALDAGVEGSPDAEVDGGLPPSGDLVARDVCLQGERQVAISAAGDLLAYVDCGSEPARVVVRDLFGSAVIEIAEAEPDYEVGFSPDGKYVLFGDDAGLFVRRAVGLGATSRIASRPVEWIDIVSLPSELAIVALVADGAYRGLVVRYETGGTAPFSSGRVLLDGADLLPESLVIDPATDTALLAVTGRYYRLDLAPEGERTVLALDPAVGRVLPGGWAGDRAMVRLTDGTIVFRSLVVEDAGTVVGRTAADVVPELVSWRDTAYYTASGRLMALELSAPAHPAVLRELSATALWLSPAHDRIVYSTVDGLESTALSGTVATRLVDQAPIAPVAFSPSGQVASVVEGAIVLSPIDMRAPRDLRAEPIGARVSYDGLGDQVLYRERADDRGRSDVLRTVGALTGEPVTEAWDTAAFWPVPQSSDVVYAHRRGERVDLRILR